MRSLATPSLGESSLCAVLTFGRCFVACQRLGPTSFLRSMKLSRLICLFLTLSLGVCAQDTLFWAHGGAQYMNREGPYIAHIQFASEEKRIFNVTVEDVYGATVGSGSTTVGPTVDAKESVFVYYTQLLTVGNTYTVRVDMTKEDGVKVAGVARNHVAVVDKIRFATELTSIGLTSGYLLDVVYTASEARSIVIALKEPTDFSYLGSKRVDVPAGDGVAMSIPVGYGGAGGSLYPNQPCIMRADIRPLQHPAKDRLDRTERNVVAGYAVVTSSATPTPMPTPTPTMPQTPTPSATAAVSTPNPPAPIIPFLHYEVVPTQLFRRQSNEIRATYSAPQSGLAVQLRIKDSANKVVLINEISVSAGSGTVTMNFILRGNSATGTANVRLALIPAGGVWNQKVIPGVFSFPDVM